ncbi:MAG: DnaJ domain-containing protein, partial [Phormidesmis sp.]
MRIPLDYYRILGLPIQATAEQLQQSHRDRTLQVPRREYSELAIDARRQLIDRAYEVLGNSARRAEYDQAFLSKTKGGPGKEAESVNDPDANVPTIEVEDPLLIGALLILLELGEYELVLRLGRAYIKRDASTIEGQKLKEQPALPDIILSLAVACLELGREEWQQNHYEHAAESLETGRELLLKEDLLPVLRAEIQADLYKLRPYRCLDLISRPLDQKQSRREGINLLRSMLQDRGGIDGADDDLSGLGVDDFLRFVQQLRGYLTAAEQQEIFEAEAQRPSAVGTYLAVYALLARGFAQHQPALIRRAKQMLLRLSGRQDVHLEQAVCAVLLGQTEEASRSLELSQEFDPLAFIREHSQGSPDLLPGLCLYAENWLQQEVFPFFRDLDQAQSTLKDYFADSAVQTYLENIPLENTQRATQRNFQENSQSNLAETWSAQATARAIETSQISESSVATIEADTTSRFEPSMFGEPARFSPPDLG